MTAGADVVLGRISDTAPVEIAWPILPVDSVESVETADTSRLALGPALELSRRAAVGGTEHVAVLAGRAVATTTASRSTDAQAPTGITVSDPTAGWVDGRFVAGLTVTSGGTGDLVALPLLRHRASGAEVWLTDSAITGTGGTVRADITIDVPAVLADGLERGDWRLELGIGEGTARTGGNLTIVPFPATGAPGILVDGVLVVVAARDGALVLDVGATASSVLRPLRVPQVSIVESVRGTLMTVDLPDLAVHGESQVKGSVLLGGFRLAAVLVGDGSSARLECYLSGLAGSSTMSTRFGTRRPVESGLDLQISPVGVMTVVPTPKPKPATSPAKKPAAKKAAPSTPPAKTTPQPRPAATSGLRSLRRRVPAPLEPVARRVAANPTAKRVYRRLVGLPPETTKSS